MPDVREKLVELLQSKYDHYCDQCGVNKDSHYTENLADYLIANGVTIQRWIPVTERLPDRMMECVCRYVFGDDEEYPFYQVLWYFALEKTPNFQNEGVMRMRVTHWMPLPEPPKEE